MALAGGYEMDLISHMQVKALNHLTTQYNQLIDQQMVQHLNRQEDCEGNGFGNQQSALMWAQAFGPVKEFVKKHMTFWRVNEEIKQEEGASYLEPLDELRLKVSRWLNGIL